jgi:hypothetical protein
MSNEQDYHQLCDIVQTIDPSAAEYMRTHSPRLRLQGVLDGCFVFSDTPQGHRYWYDIHKQVEAIRKREEENAIMSKSYTQSLTKEEAQRQIDELQRHIKAIDQQPAIPIPYDIKVGDTVILNNGEHRRVNEIYLGSDPRIHIEYDELRTLAVVRMATGREWAGEHAGKWVVAIDRTAKRNNHPAEYERGQLFKRNNIIYMVVAAGKENRVEFDLRAVTGRVGIAWMKDKFFDGDEDQFEYIGHASTRLKIID